MYSFEGRSPDPIDQTGSYAIVKPFIASFGNMLSCASITLKVLLSFFCSLVSPTQRIAPTLLFMTVSNLPFTDSSYSLYSNLLSECPTIQKSIPDKL